MDRREFLRSAALSPLAAAGGSALLAACNNVNSHTSSGSFDLARPDHPVQLPIYEDISPIGDGRDIETGPLRIYNWEEYIRPQVIRDFKQQHDVEVEVTTFTNMQEALGAFGRGRTNHDLFFHRVDVIGRLVASRLLQPLNHSYLGNFLRNAWPVYRDPFYDLGARYTVPYTVYTTGIAWRADKVPDDISALENPYEIFWDRRYGGRIHLMNDYREVVSMALLKNGISDLNTTDRDALRAAREDLASVRGNIGGLDIDGYSDIPSGEAWIHQAWSGDMLAAPFYFKEKEDASVLRYWFPTEGDGAVANDAIGIMRSAANPVLAHLFINHLFDGEVSARNFEWNGYQPPLKRLGIVIPDHLASTVVRRRSFNLGSMQLELDPSAEKAWKLVYAQFARGLPGGVA